VRRCGYRIGIRGAAKTQVCHPSDEDLSFRPKNENLFLGTPAPGSPGARPGAPSVVSFETWATPQGTSGVVCEVNVEPPNPALDAFHVAMGFEEIGRPSIYSGAKVMMYF
jgi:hypothetical protein